MKLAVRLRMWLNLIVGILFVFFIQYIVLHFWPENHPFTAIQVYTPLAIISINIFLLIVLRISRTKGVDGEYVLSAGERMVVTIGFWLAIFVSLIWLVNFYVI